MANGKNSNTNLGVRARQLDSPNLTVLDNGANPGMTPNMPSTATALRVVFNPRPDDNLKPSERRAKAERETKLAEEKRIHLASTNQYKTEREKQIHDAYAQEQNYWKQRNAGWKTSLTQAEQEGNDEDIIRYHELYQQGLAYEAESLAIAQATRDRNLTQLAEVGDAYWSPTLQQIVHIGSGSFHNRDSYLPSDAYTIMHIRC